MSYPLIQYFNKQKYHLPHYCRGVYSTIRVLINIKKCIQICFILVVLLYTISTTTTTIRNNNNNDDNNNDDDDDDEREKRKTIYIDMYIFETKCLCH